MLDSKTRLIVLAVVTALVVVSAIVFFVVAPQDGGTQTQNLPPIQTADIPPGFVGKHQFGLWQLVCEGVAPKGAQAGAAPVHVCRSNSRVMVRSGNSQPLLAAGLNVVMMKAQPRPGLLFRLPPAASAAASIDFAIDGNTAFSVPLRCSQTECIAQGALPAEAVEQLRTGKLLSVVYTIKDKQNQDRKVRVDQQLHGFRESFDAMARAVSA
jgi:invasion protein IalB